MRLGDCLLTIMAALVDVVDGLLALLALPMSSVWLRGRIHDNDLDYSFLPYRLRRARDMSCVYI
jgi:hypothetical protein